MYRSPLRTALRSSRFPCRSAPFAQMSLSILLDTHVREEQDHLEVSPVEARLPLPSPRAVSLTAKLRIERQEGSTSSARFSPLPRGLTFCPTYRTARLSPQRFQATTLEPDSLHARTVFAFLKKENTPCQKITKLSSVVLLKKFGIRAICRWLTSSLLPTTNTMTLRHPILGAAPRVKRREQLSTALLSPTCE